jgi:hypothetical protein
MAKQTKRRAFALLFVCLAVACAETPAAPRALDGDWDVQQIAGASLGEGVRIRTDETRFLAVLASIARFSRHGRALELLPREPGEALLRLRFSDAQDAEGGE